MRRVFEREPINCAHVLKVLGERVAQRRAYHQAPQRNNKPIYATIAKELEKWSNHRSGQVYTVTKEVDISNQRGLRIRDIDITKNQRYVTSRFSVEARTMGIFAYGESLDEAFYHLGEYLRRHGRCRVEKGCGRVYEGDECSHCALHHALQPPIECGICFELTTYDYEMLCGHHFCKPCLGKLKKMECPVCRDSRDVLHLDAGWRERKRRRCNAGYTHIVYEDEDDDGGHDTEDDEDEAWDNSADGE